MISASISDNAGNTSAIVSDFTVGSSTEPNRYIFSVNNNDWIFASPGDGTCVEYLRREVLGILSFSDVVALSKVTTDGNLFFTLSGQGGILQSPADDTNSMYFDNLPYVVSSHNPLKKWYYLTRSCQAGIIIKNNRL